MAGYFSFLSMNAPEWSIIQLIRLSYDAKRYKFAVDGDCQHVNVTFLYKKFQLEWKSS